MTSISSKPDSFFVIRLPRQSNSLLQRLPSEPEALWQFLFQWSQQPEIHLALYIASPSLTERLDQVINPDHKQREKLTSALLKYFIRSSTRPTPFGLFAGVHRGVITAETSLMTAEQAKDQKVSRLDMFYLTELRERLTRPTLLKSHQLLYANPTLWLRDGHYHYIDAYQGKQRREFRLSAVQHEPYLQQLIGWCAQPCAVSALRARFLTAYPECSAETFADYLQQLVDERVLLLHLPLVLTTREPDLHFAKALRSFGATQEGAVVEDAVKQLREFDQLQPGNVPALKKIASTLRQLDYPVNDAKLIQTDSWRAMSACSLDGQLNQRLWPVILSLLQIGKPRKLALEQFSQSFVTRYETARVPLLAVLDDESGISFSNETGFSSPFLAGLPLRKSKGSTNTGLPNDIWQRWPLDANHNIVQLSSAELLKGVALNKLASQMPCSFAMKFALYGETTAPKIHYQGCSGSSAANLLGRFCHLNGQLEQDVRQHLSKEQQLMPDVILAEIVHLPDGRPGNVIARPVLRPYEIVLLADSGVDDEYQISLKDLSVYIQQGQVCLWSERLQRRVIPRLSNAHNFSQRSLGIYRFLSSLAQQAVSQPAFYWPDEMLKLPFLPRVEIDQCVVSCARWRLPRSTLVQLLQQLQNKPDCWTEFSTRYQIPADVCYAISDNVLTIHLQHLAQLRLLIEETEGLEFVVFEEALTAQYKSSVQGPDGSYAHEILWPVFNDASQQRNVGTMNVSKQIQADRHFAAGSDWLTCKIYCGHSSAEMLLQLLAPSILEWQLKGWCTEWFFLRYGDPDWHLRLRFKGESTQLFGQLYPSLYQRCEPMLKSGRISNIMIVSYVRETERYGGELAIDAAERWFYQESAYLMPLLSEIQEQGEIARFVLALEMVDLVLTAFHFDMKEKLSWTTDIRQRFADEMQETTQIRQQLGGKYRQYSNVIDTFTANISPRHQQYLKQQQEITAIYLALAKRKQLVLPLNQVIGSFTHMLLNRIFKAYGREHEYLVYDMLRRRYLGLSYQRKPTV